MMHGDAAARGAAAEIWVLEKPDWMLVDENGASWSDAQRRLAAEWAAEQARLDEERCKRRAALKSEVRSCSVAFRSADSVCCRQGSNQSLVHRWI